MVHVALYIVYEHHLYWEVSTVYQTKDVQFPLHFLRSDFNLFASSSFLLLKHLHFHSYLLIFTHENKTNTTYPQKYQSEF